MGKLARDTIEKLHAGGTLAHSAAATAEELLRKHAAPHFQSHLAEVNAEGLSDDEAAAVRQALHSAVQKAENVRARRNFLFVLARTGDPSVKADVEDELAAVLVEQREAASSLWFALTALDAIGEAVFADDLQSAGIDSVEGNVRCAERYLGRLGRSIPH
jgi:phosphoribosylformylglycinamidine (FGAM) synthase PurS component